MARAGKVRCIRDGRNDEWNEKDHPRDDNGRFTSGGVSGGDFFNLKSTGASYYNDLIPGSKENDYMRKQKNRKGEIVQMSPKEYYEACAKMFGSSVERLKSQRNADPGYIKELEGVIQNKGQFPLCYINYADNGQEGLHRMMAAANVTSWDKKFPVLVVDYADKERAEREEEEHRKNEIERKLSNAVDEAAEYHFADEDEFKEEIQFMLNKEFDSDYDKQFTYDKTSDGYRIGVDGASYDIPYEKVKLDRPKDEEPEDLDIDEELLNMSTDELLKYLGLL